MDLDRLLVQTLTLEATLFCFLKSLRTQPTPRVVKTPCWDTRDSRGKRMKKILSLLLPGTYIRFGILLASSKKCQKMKA